MTLTKTRNTPKTRSLQLDEKKDLWMRETQTTPYKLEEFAPNLESASTGEIAGIEQYQNFEETRSIFVERHIILLAFVLSRSPANLNSNLQLRQSRDSVDESFRTDLDAKTNTYNEQTSKVLLDELLDMGFAWIHIAKMIHTPVYIVRDLACDKDNCEKLSKESHTKLAQLLALVETFAERFPDRNIPSWLETTLDGYYYSGIDVIAKNQIELLVRYAYEEITNIELLNKCFPNWEDNFDRRIEAFTASDGETAIRLRNDNLED